MGLAIPKQFKQFVTNVTWRGRCCGLSINLLSQKPQWERSACASVVGGHDGNTLLFIGLHHKPGEDIAGLLADVLWLIKQAPRGCMVLISGDWNLDVLKWSQGQPSNDSHHFISPSQAEEEENWLALHNFVQARMLTFRIPEVMLNAQQFELIHQTTAPFSRVPVGSQGLSARPSLIDWSLCSSSLRCQERLDWAGAPGDHAWLLVTVCMIMKKRKQRPQKTWGCGNVDKMCRQLAAFPPDLANVPAAMASLRSAMIQNANGATAKERKVQREPFAIRQLRARLHNATDESWRVKWQKRLHSARAAWYKTMAEQATATRIYRGGVVKRRQALWPIRALARPDGAVTHSNNEMLQMVGEHFASKWRVEQMQHELLMIRYVLEKRYILVKLSLSRRLDV